MAMRTVTVTYAAWGTPVSVSTCGLVWMMSKFSCGLLGFSEELCGFQWKSTQQTLRTRTQTWLDRVPTAWLECDEDDAVGCASGLVCGVDNCAKFHAIGLATGIKPTSDCCENEHGYVNVDCFALSPIGWETLFLRWHIHEFVLVWISFLALSVKCMTP